MIKLYRSSLLLLCCILLCTASCFAETATAVKGTVKVKVLYDVMENGVLKSVPDRYVRVTKDSWQGNGYLGDTDEEGMLTFETEESELDLWLFKMTSSKSYVIKEYDHKVKVTPGQTTEVVFHWTTEGVVYTKDTSVDYGKALYITGQSDYLGNWNVAYKLTYEDYANRWVYRGFIPYNCAFKVIKADWVEGNSISTNDKSVVWQKGDNHYFYGNSGAYPYMRAYETSPQF